MKVIVGGGVGQSRDLERVQETGPLRSAKSIRIRGLVQGVGFRPFVWQLARGLGLAGHVLNDGEGVLIEASGDERSLDLFLSRLQSGAPLLARIDQIVVSDLVGALDARDFRILPSEEGKVATGVVPDVATCPACLADIRNPADRRYRYAFANCTHCGPRLSILRHIPYDRASTAMAAFEMCRACRIEYENPADRRFHAQPIACPQCGPKLWFEDKDGCAVDGDPVVLAAERLGRGAILAIKGLGGFQIAVDAGNQSAIEKLRLRKHRPVKPLALMARDLDQIRDFALADAKEVALLESPAAPIVLLKKAGAQLAPGIAGPFDRLGVMLPNTPLHHLLMAELKGPIVLTSGNLSENPQETQNECARHNLAGIVDGFLMHNRDVVNRLDDSVVRQDRSGVSILRRARGYAPSPIRLPTSFEGAPKVLALGGELKATFCLLDGRNAVLSQHIGDLENAPTLADYKKMLRLYLDLYQFEPDIVAVDAHPQYLSTRTGEDFARERGLPLVRVQHHHAHLAACLADQGQDQAMPGTVHAVVLDGLGWGADGTVWGGEILQGSYGGFVRCGHFRQVPLPGGEAANREPWRNLAAQLFTAFGVNYRANLVGTGLETRFADHQAKLLDQMMQKGVNAPMTSSAGRLFDAVAAALDICPDKQGFEGEAAMQLEVLARASVAGKEGYPVEVTTSETVKLSFDKVWPALLGDLKSGVKHETISARFHQGLIDGLARSLSVAGARPSGKVVLSGGVFQNAFLRDGLTEKLETDGYTVLNHKSVPANDGGLALGQAVIAANLQAPSTFDD